MAGSRDILKIATFRPMLLLRKGEAAELPAPVVREDAQSEAAQPGALRREGEDNSDHNVMFLQAGLRPQTIDLRGNFFRLPRNGPIGLRILTDPDAAPDPVLRLRQDRRIEILAHPRLSGMPEPFLLKKDPDSLGKNDTKTGLPGPELPGA